MQSRPGHGRPARGGSLTTKELHPQAVAAAAEALTEWTAGAEVDTGGFNSLNFELLQKRPTLMPNHHRLLMRSPQLLSMLA